jgi:hypothetical protein
MFVFLRVEGYCWICHNRGDLTREHKFKASGLRKQYGETTYYVSAGGVSAKRYKIAQSSNSNALKFGPSICNRCNSHTTQKADMAFDDFQAKVEELARNGDAVEQIWNSSEFKIDSRSYLDLFRYFAKLLGCHLVEAGYPVPRHLSRFARGATSRNCIWLNVHETELQSSQEGAVRQATHGGLVVLTRKPNFRLTAVCSSITFGKFNYSFHYRWTWPELMEIKLRFPQFYAECQRLGKLASEQP